MKPLLEKAIEAEKEAQAKTEARKSAEQAVLRAQMMLSKAQEDLKAKKAFEARAIAAKEELPKLEAQKAAIEAKIKDAKVALEAALEKLATAKDADAKAQEELPEFHPEVTPTRPQVGPTTYGNGQAPSGAGQAAPQADKPSYSRVASRHGLPQTGDKGSALAGLGFLGLFIGLGYKRRQESR